MKLSFYGAAREVTGSCYLIETERSKILIDCGMFQGSAEKRFSNDITFNVREIDALLLTHAHIDHSGRIPLLAKKGFRGRIICTDATRQLSEIMLLDSASIQESDARYQSKKNLRVGKKPVDPLYTKEDAEEALKRFMGVAYNNEIHVTDDVSCSFSDAGHLLGSASITVSVTEHGRKRAILFSGDVGNIDQPIIKDPSRQKGADLVLIESTYGDRLHDRSMAQSSMERAIALADITERTFARGGKLIIPSFSVGRSQELLYLYRIIMTEKLLPYEIPVYLDSPLSVKATEVFMNAMRGDYYDEEAMELVRKGINPVDFPSLRKVVTQEESQKLNSIKTSCVIISSSGMCDAGRIRHHLKHGLWRPENTILFVGFQGEGTLGRRLLEGAKTVNIFGERIKVNAEIRTLSGMSGHADREGLEKFLLEMDRKPELVLVVHGDNNTTQTFANRLHDEYGYRTYAPVFGETIDLDAVLPKGKKAVIDNSDALKELEEAWRVLEVNRRAVDALLEVLEKEKDGMKSSENSEIEELTKTISRLSEEIERVGEWV